MNNKNIIITLLFVLIIGASLRIIGLKWGLPTNKYFHSASFHPDESEVLKAYQGINPRKLDFRLRTLTVQTKGTFHPYLMALWIKTASVFKLTKIYSSFDYYKANPKELVNLYIVGRSMSVVFGILTLILLFFFGKIVYGDYRIGLLSSFILAITPVHIINSHYISTDITLTFLTTVILILSFHIAKNGGIKTYISTGILLGIAGATKYSIAPLVIIPLLAHILSGKKITDRKLIYYFLFIPAGFFIGNPYSLIEPGSFISSLKSSLEINTTNPVTQNTLDCFGPQNNFLFYFFTATKYGFGIPLSLLFLSSLIYAFIKREKTDIIFAGWVIIFWSFISLMSPWQLVRWQLPYVPVLCLLAARFIVAVSAGGNKYIRLSLLSAACLIFFYTALYSISCVKIMAEKDVRDEASEWIESNIPEGKRIAVPNVYFWNPSIVMMEHWYKNNELFLKEVKQYKIFQVWYDLELLKKANPDYIFLADFEFYPLLNLKNKYTHPEMTALLNEITKSGKYRLVKVFERPPKIFGIKTMCGFPPHEWRYINPEIRAYQKAGD